MTTTRKRAALLFAVLCAGLLGSVCVWSQAEVTLHGIVADPNGAPVAHATLTLYSVDRVQTETSNDKGAFEFTKLPPGVYELQAEGAGFKTRKLEPFKIADKPPLPVSIKLDPAASSACSQKDASPADLPLPNTTVTYGRRIAYAQVVGTVRSYQNDRPKFPLSDVYIQIFMISKQGKVQSMKSDARGQFHFIGLDPGKYEVLASHDGYRDLFPTMVWVTRENITQMVIDLVQRDKEPKPGC